MRLATLILALVLARIGPAMACDHFQPEAAVRACWLAHTPFDGVLRSTRADILRYFGEPKSITRIEQPNPHGPEQIDTYELLQYDKTEIGVLFIAGDPSRPFPAYLETTDPKLRLRYGIHVGMKAAELTEILGDPSRRDGETWPYGGEAGEILFTVTDGKVAKITWHPYQG